MAFFWSIQRVFAGACYPLLLIVLLSASIGVVEYNLWVINLAIFSILYFILGFPIATTLFIFYWLIEYAHQIGTYQNFYSYALLCLLIVWVVSALLGCALIWRERKAKNNPSFIKENKPSKKLALPIELSISQNRAKSSDSPSRPTNSVLIGIGGMGGNVLNHLIANHNPQCTLLCINTDAQALDNSLAPYTLLIGESMVRGLGTGRNVALGKAAAAGTLEKMRLYAKDADMICLIAGLGGGTGSGAIQVYAQHLLNLGKRVVCIVSTPFRFEGKDTELVAQETMRELDHIGVQKIVLNNQDLLETANGHINFADIFKAADEAIAAKVYDLLEHGQITDDTPLAIAATAGVYE